MDRWYCPADLEAINIALLSIKKRNISPIHLLKFILASDNPMYASYRSSLDEDLKALLRDKMVLPLAIKTVLDLCASEVSELSSPAAGFHFGANKARAAQFFEVDTIHFANQYESKAPTTWKLLAALLESNPVNSRRREAYHNKVIKDSLLKNNGTERAAGNGTCNHALGAHTRLNFSSQMIPHSPALLGTIHSLVQSP